MLQGLVFVQAFWRTPSSVSHPGLQWKVEMMGWVFLHPLPSKGIAKLQLQICMQMVKSSSPSTPCTWNLIHSFQFRCPHVGVHTCTKCMSTSVDFGDPVNTVKGSSSPTPLT